MKLRVKLAPGTLRDDSEPIPQDEPLCRRLRGRERFREVVDRTAKNIRVGV